MALTAAGPFIYLARRYSRRLPGYPRLGDRLWAFLGLPWLVTAVIQSALPGEDPRQNPLFSTTLSIGLAIVVPDRPGPGLGDLGGGPARPGGADRGRPLDQSRRPGPGHRLADSVRPGHGGVKLKRASPDAG